MRTGRMFEIIQLLRNAKAPLTAQDMADTLEVTKRTVYRDISALQARRVPIEGAAGIGYIIRASYDLPAVNFDAEEAEAVSVALRMIARTGDKGLERAAARATAKLTQAMAFSDTLYSSNWGPELPARIDMTTLRSAIRSETKLHLAYSDAVGAQTTRTICPLAVIYYSDAIVIAAWCELREDFRHFRADRCMEIDVLETVFKGDGATLRKKWAALNLGAI